MTDEEVIKNFRETVERIKSVDEDDVNFDSAVDAVMELLNVCAQIDRLLPGYEE